ncbi:hypothetical protein V6N12_027113 [Hibiscus sabdariffa]|uniref:Uncharacterized protein n=1 Tax=Hibiscus sabdariffa TaxID=183260 RepID=A0ABR2DTR8_9ROSI
MVRNVPSDHYLHIYIVEVEPASRIESDSNLEDEDCGVEPETRIEFDSNSKEVEPETRIESDSNSEDEEYEVEDESSTDQSKFSDSENEFSAATRTPRIPKLPLKRHGPRTTPTNQATTTQIPSSTSTKPTHPNVFRWMPTPTVRTSQESSISHSSPSPTPIPTQASHSNVFSWMPTPGVPLSQDNSVNHLSQSPTPTQKPPSQDNCGSQSSPRIDP